jgi:hypothetical protein
MVHIHMSIQSHNNSYRTRKFHHNLCYEDISEEECQQLFDRSTAPWKDSTISDRHKLCSSHAEQTSTYLPVSSPSRLDLSLVYVCRQFYHEIKKVAYKNIGFSFDDCETLQSFMERVPASQLAAIRRLRLEFRNDAKFTPIDWHNTLSYASTSFVGLQYLHIDISRRQSGDENLMMGLQCLANMPLKGVTAVVTDTFLPYSRHGPATAWVPHPDHRGMMYGWMLEDEQDWSRRIRRSLLRQVEDVSEEA